MRREKRKPIENQDVGFKKVLYISGSVVAIAIIGFVVTFLIYGNKLENETKLGKLNTAIVDDYIGNTEETSFPMGKTVNEMTNTTSNTILDSNKTNTIANETTTKYAINTSQINKNADTNNSNKNSTSSNSTTKTGTNTENKSNTNKSKTDTKQTTDNEKTNQNINGAETKQELTFKQPVKGETIKEFAKEKLVYSNTLGEWVTHNGIDIKAEKTTVVTASEKGTVKSIKNDPRYGLTIVIEHENGFKTVYSNLLTAEFVVAGEKVSQGQTIGTVGNTATFEISDDAHLHFEILKDEVAVDPELYIKK